MTPEQLRELANHAKRCCQWADPPDPQKYLDIAAALRELADIKDAAGRGVTDEVVDIALTAMYGEQFADLKQDLEDAYRAQARRGIEAVAPLLAVQQWRPIETAPKDREILVYAPPYQDLHSLISVCQWHSDAGFCIDELRQPTHWMPLPDPPKQEKPE